MIYYFVGIPHLCLVSAKNVKFVKFVEKMRKFS